MPPLMRLVLAWLASVLGLVLVAGCGGSPEQIQVDRGQSGASVALAPNTCWTADTVGADPQTMLSLAETYGVDYFSIAHAVDGRPAFATTESCQEPHQVEVYKVIAVSRVVPRVTDYATFFRYDSPSFRKLSAAVEQACMSKALRNAATKSRVPGAVVEPVFPDGVDLGWAPPSPEQWNRGQRVYACTLVAAKPVTFRYAEVFTKAFPTGLRTCISNAPLSFVDCARKHNRERIAVIGVRSAVLAKKFPGPRAIRDGANGRFVQVPPATLSALDRACTAYLRAVSTTTRLTGVAEIDAERWPTPDGSYPIDCEADAPPHKDSLVTQGSVFDR